MGAFIKTLKCMGIGIISLGLVGTIGCGDDQEKPPTENIGPTQDESEANKQAKIREDKNKIAAKLVAAGVYENVKDANKALNEMKLSEANNILAKAEKAKAAAAAAAATPTPTPTEEPPGTEAAGGAPNPGGVAVPTGGDSPTEEVVPAGKVEAVEEVVPAGKVEPVAPAGK